MQGICKNCRYWVNDWVPPPDYGECKLLNRDPFDESKSTIAYPQSERLDNSFLRCKSNFGCVLFESIEERTN